MNAIVLGFDKQFGFLELTYKAYMALWADCPLTFRIPINDRRNDNFSVFRGRKNVVLVDTPSPFKQTARALLEGIDDEEWVFWCISDRYPSFLDVGQINRVFRFLSVTRPDRYNAIRLVNARETTDQKRIEIEGITFHTKIGQRGGFWHHQFLKAKVLRTNLVHPALSESYGVRDADARWDRIADDPSGRISVFDNTLVPEVAMARLSEPCLDGVLTVNGLADLKRYGCVIPDLPQSQLSVHF